MLRYRQRVGGRSRGPESQRYPQSGGGHRIAIVTQGIQEDREQMSRREAFGKCLMVAGIAATALIAATRLAAQVTVYAYPLKGQSGAAQKADHADCYQWAVQQTGFDPRRPPTVAYGTPPASGGFGAGQVGQGGVMRDAAGGAALGAIGGAIAGDAGKGAAIGAASGALFGGIRRANRQAEEQRWYAEQQQMAAQQYQAGSGNHMRAYASCMAARGYSVQ